VHGGGGVNTVGALRQIRLLAGHEDEVDKKLVRKLLEEKVRNK
jgi:hypothetical protein